MNEHLRKVEELQVQLRRGMGPVALRYRKGHSNTTRTKVYKNGLRQLDCGAFDEILAIDPAKRVAIVEPRVTMEALAQATLPLGLRAPVIPEFKGITVGGAIMGGGAESSSHQHGIFSDACLALTMICGDGSLLRTSATESPDIFYGLSGSYGSLGALVSAEIRLVPAKDSVLLLHRVFSDPAEAVRQIQARIHAVDAPEFIEGMIFAKDHAVVIEGRSVAKVDVPDHLPRSSLQSPQAEWYWQHVKSASSDFYEETMPLEDYLFRHDRGAFWMGAYLFHLPLLARIAFEGILGIGKGSSQGFSDEEVRAFCRLPSPGAFLRALSSPLLSSQRLWGIFHKAEKWLQQRVLVQDFCIPESHAARFLQQVLQDPGTFPIWLCPIQGTRNPQIFAPHLLNENSPDRHFINVGIYGLPSYYAPIEQITKRLENLTHSFGGRKVLYSRSYYSPEQFWRIYNYDAYDDLRTKTHAKGIWHDITEKVLSA